MFLKRLFPFAHASSVSLSQTTEPPDASLLVKQLNALADPMRLQILFLLPQEVPLRPDQQVMGEEQAALTVQGIEERVGTLAQPTISYHLKVLREAGLVEFRKYHTYCYYYRRSDRILLLSRLLEVLASEHHPS